MRPIAPLALLMSLAGCSAGMGVAYPSLAPRAVERAGFEEPAAPAAGPVAGDPTLDGAIADLAKRSDAVTKGFAADATRAERLSSAPAARVVGGEAWLDAQSAIASLDDWHAQAGGLVADAEQLAIDRAAALAPDYPALAALHSRLEAETARQQAIIQRLAGSLPTP